MEYIVGEKPSGCVLCEKGSSTNDEADLVLYRGRTCFLMMNLYPYNPGHLMVVPYRHVHRLPDLDGATRAELMTLSARSVELLDDLISPAGYNLGMNLGEVAGAGIADHLHQHVVPRWGGDTNFMPVLGGVRSLPEDLGSTYRKVRAVIDERLAANPRFWDTGTGSA